MKYINIKFVRTIVFSFVIMLPISCSVDDFGDMNYNPKQPTKPVTSYLLTHSLRYIPQSLIYNASSEPQSSFFVKYLSRLQYNELYNLWLQPFSYYQSVLINLEKIIAQAENEEAIATIEAYGDVNNQLAVARILKAYFYLNMTDMWGDIPFSEALQGQENIRPKFDTQEEIYNALFDELKASVELINTDFITPLAGDFLFNSDMEKWLKFANTTRLIMAMRISDVNPTKAQTEIQDAINAKGGIIESTQNNLYYNFIDDEEQANNNVFYNVYNASIPAYVPNDVFINSLKEINDPRLQVFSEPTVLDGTYKGKSLESGQTDPNSISYLGVNLRQKESPLAIYSYSQVLFALSEAALRGLIEGGTLVAEQYYYDAIKESFIENDVFNSAEYNNYIVQNEVAFSTNAAYEKIGKQKWLALFPRGNEAWAEWRRLDYPELIPVSGAITEDGNIPVRNTYNDNIINLMPEQWAEVNKRQPDKSYTRIWWDVK